MRYLVFSDIHGNLPALESLLAKEKSVEGYINLGDVVNYGPWSNECVEIVDNLDNCLNIIGNHEDYFSAGNCDVPSLLVQSFFNICYENFKYKKIIDSYNKLSRINGFDLIHTTGKKDYVFKDSEINLSNNTFLGHSHQQYLRWINNCLIINPGSVGQNRSCINVANYVIWNTETGQIELKWIKYDIDLLLNEMKVRKYPAECIEYYGNKSTI